MGAIWLNGSVAGYPSLPDVLGPVVPIELWPGWSSRSRSSGGYSILAGVVDHHTASNATPQADCSYMWDNSPDRPVASLLLDRTGKCWIGCAGAANHAGKGGPWTCSKGTVGLDNGNQNLLGLEVANGGTGEPWPTVQQDAYTTIVAALADAYGWDLRERGQFNTDTMAHHEWVLPSCPGRKVDPFGPSRFGNQQWDMNLFRAECRAKQGGVVPPPSEEDDVAFACPLFIQANGEDGSFAGAVYATDGRYQTIKYLNEWAYADAQYWAAAMGRPADELKPQAVARVLTYGILLNPEEYTRHTGASPPT